MNHAPTAPSWRRFAPLGWQLVILVAALVTLHSLAILPLSRQTLTLSSVVPFEGAAYIVELPPRSYPEPEEPAERLFENGQPVPYPNMAGWGPVVKDGGGRYRINGNTLYFSTLDNSDPRSNGRTYTVTRPTPIHRRLVKVLWVLAVIATLILGVPRLPALMGLAANPPCVLAAALFVVLVIANRAWYFIDFPMPAIHPDSGGYFAAAEQIGNGTWPNFGNRPLVYPLFLKAVFSAVDRASFLVVCQTLLSTLAGLSLVYAAYRWMAPLALPAAGVVALFLFGFTTIEHDTAMLSESLYTTFLMSAFGALLVGIRARSPRWLGWASAAMALAILTRPAGVFLEVSYLIVAGWLMFNRFPRRATAAFLIPFPVLLLLMCTYNWRVVGVFATTTWGEANLAGATLLSWQTDPEYPPEINASIEQIQDVIQKRYVATKKDPGVLERSWDPDKLGPVFLDGFNWEALAIAVKLGGNYETVARTWIRRVAFDAIKKRPVVYAKFVYTMMHHYYRPTEDYDFRAYLQNRAWLYYVSRNFSAEKGDAFMVRLGKEFADAVPPPAVVITDFDPATPKDLQDRVLIPPTRGWRVYDFTHRIRYRVYDSWFWPFGLLVALVCSGWVLVRTRMRHHGAFVVFIVAVSTLGASLVVSLVEYSQPRYSYPMEWAHGLSVVLLPLLFMKPTPSPPPA
jgi:hypothetical protein